MYLHGKYSKTKEKKLYRLSVIVKRHDGTIRDCYYYSTLEKAQQGLELYESFYKDLKPNQYFFGYKCEIDII